MVVFLFFKILNIFSIYQIFFKDFKEKTKKVLLLQKYWDRYFRTRKLKRGGALYLFLFDNVYRYLL